MEAKFASGAHRGCFMGPKDDWNKYWEEAIVDGEGWKEEGN